MRVLWVKSTSEIGAERRDLKEQRQTSSHKEFKDLDLPVAVMGLHTICNVDIDPGHVCFTEKVIIVGDWQRQSNPHNIITEGELGSSHGTWEARQDYHILLLYLIYSKLV